MTSPWKPAWIRILDLPDEALCEERDQQGQHAALVSTAFRRDVLEAADAEISRRKSAWQTRTGPRLLANLDSGDTYEAAVCPTVAEMLPDGAVIRDISCARLSPREAGDGTGGFVQYQKRDGSWFRLDLDGTVSSASVSRGRYDNRLEVMSAGDPFLVGVFEDFLEGHVDECPRWNDLGGECDCFLKMVSKVIADDAARVWTVIEDVWLNGE